MSILKEHMRHMEREQLSFHQSELTGFFLAALDFRAQFCQVRLVLSRRTVCPRDLLNVLLGAGRPGDGSSDRGQRHRLPAGHGDETVRSHVQAVLLQGDASLLLTLFDLGRTCNSGEMKSRFAFSPQLFDWSKSGRKERLLTFFRLSDCIAERLKGLFVLFAGNLVKPFADLLQQTNVSKTGEACIFFNPPTPAPTTRKLISLGLLCPEEPLFDSEHGAEKSQLLLCSVLDCLHKIFLYDTQRFLSKERAEALLVPLVDQVSTMTGPLSMSIFGGLNKRRHF